MSETPTLHAAARQLTATLDHVARDLGELHDDYGYTELDEVLDIIRGTLDQFAFAADHPFVSCTHGWGCSDEWCHAVPSCPLRPPRHPTGAEHRPRVPTTGGG